MTACNLVAEIGVKMEQFPSAQHLASWAALCPGNHGGRGGGKRKPGKTRDGNKWLRRSLCPAAWCATARKTVIWHPEFRRLGGRRGLKRAIIAVAHTKLVIGYHMLRTNQGYRELGANYLDRINEARASALSRKAPAESRVRRSHSNPPSPPPEKHFRESRRGEGSEKIAVGTQVTLRPPHRSERA